jgi:hypothetical protein
MTDYVRFDSDRVAVPRNAPDCGSVAGQTLIGRRI